MPISDQATSPHRPARATKAFEKNGARSVAKSSPLGPKLRGSLGGPIIVGPVLAPVPVPPRHVDELIEPAGEEAIESLRDAASALSGARILELNSTNFGGGVAELLFSQVGLMIDLGLHTEWRVMGGHEDFFAVMTKIDADSASRWWS